MGRRWLGVAALSQALCVRLCGAAQSPRGWAHLLKQNRFSCFLERVFLFGLCKFKVLPPLNVFESQEWDEAGFGGGGQGRWVPWCWVAPGEESAASREV